MTVLPSPVLPGQFPSPIPSPLDLHPWELPRWVDEAVTWVFGLAWPEADEKQTWDVADHWYAAAAERTATQPPADTGSRTSAPLDDETDGRLGGVNPAHLLDGAGPGDLVSQAQPAELTRPPLPGADHIGVRPAGSKLESSDLWPGTRPVEPSPPASQAHARATPTESADFRTPGGGPAGADPRAWLMDPGPTGGPMVVSLIELSNALGQVIEECGRDIEAAKLEAWIELVTFLIELVGMAVAVTLTLGPAASAADALIAATRFAIQQTFRRLDNQLARKSISPPLMLTEMQLTGR